MSDKKTLNLKTLHAILEGMISYDDETVFQLRRLSLPANDARPFTWLRHGWDHLSMNQRAEAMRLVYLDHLEALQTWYNVGCDRTNPHVRSLEKSVSDLRRDWGFVDVLSREDRLRLIRTAIRENSTTLRNWRSMQFPDAQRVRSLKRDIRHLETLLTQEESDLLD